MLTMLVSRGKRSRRTARPVPAGTPALAGPDQRRPIRQAIPAGTPDRGRWHRWRAPANAVVKYNFPGRHLQGFKDFFRSFSAWMVDKA